MALTHAETTEKLHELGRGNAAEMEAVSGGWKREMVVCTVPACQCPPRKWYLFLCLDSHEDRPIEVPVFGPNFAGRAKVPVFGPDFAHFYGVRSESVTWVQTPNPSGGHSSSLRCYWGNKGKSSGGQNCYLPPPA